MNSDILRSTPCRSTILGARDNASPKFSKCIRLPIDDFIDGVSYTHPARNIERHKKRLGSARARGRYS